MFAETTFNTDEELIAYFQIKDKLFSMINVVFVSGIQYFSADLVYTNVVATCG